MTNILLWVLQLLLAVAYFAHGWLLLSPPASLAAQVHQMALPLRLLVGVAELLASAGLVLPGLTRIAPWLIPLAAAGLMPIMLGATVFHLARAEFSSAAVTVVLLALLTLVAYMRWKVAPIQPRVRAGS